MQKIFKDKYLHSVDTWKLNSMEWNVKENLNTAWVDFQYTTTESVHKQATKHI